MRCTGHCCKNFPLPASPEELKLNYEAWRKGWSSDASGRKVIQDIYLIYPMVIHNGGNRYSCKHLKENGDCGIYENRPRVCSGYPYGERCRTEGCTMTDETGVVLQ